MDRKTEKLLHTKLLILYLIFKMDMPLSLIYLNDFIMESGHAEFFAFQEVILGMEEDGLIKKTNVIGSDYYILTEYGEKTIRDFTDHLPNYIKEDIIRYVKKNKKEIKDQYSVAANYFQNSSDDFFVRCGVYDDDIVLLDLKVTGFSKEQAKLAKHNFKKNADVIYKKLIKMLLDDGEN